MTRFQKFIGEIAGGAILLVVGVVWAIGAGDYGIVGEGGRLAPGTVPFLCGTALAITGGFIAVKALVQGLRPAGDSTDANSESATSTEAGADNTAPASAGAPGVALDTARPSLGRRIRLAPVNQPVLTVYLLLASGLLVMPLLGFSASFALLIFAILRLVEGMSLRTAAIVGVITAGCGYLLFEVLFNLPLPEPIFF